VVANTPWRCKKLLTAGHAATDWGVHHFDELRYSLGEVDWVSAEVRAFEPVRYLRDSEGEILDSVDCEVDDSYFAIAGLRNGAVAHMMWSIAGYGDDFRTPGLVIYGSEGCIQGAEIIARDGRRDDLVNLFNAAATKADLESFFPQGLQDAAALQQLDWLTAIEKGATPEVDGAEGLRDVACCFAVLESAHAGRRVTIQDVLSGKESAFQKEIDEHYGF
jgi:predicted dehydrogenase